jgi:hypothetical protein
VGWCVITFRITRRKTRWKGDIRRLSDGWRQYFLETRLQQASVYSYSGYSIDQFYNGNQPVLLCIALHLYCESYFLVKLVGLVLIWAPLESVARIKLHAELSICKSQMESYRRDFIWGFQSRFSPVCFSF